MFGSGAPSTVRLRDVIAMTSKMIFDGIAMTNPQRRGFWALQQGQPEALGVAWEAYINSIPAGKRKGVTKFMRENAPLLMACGTTALIVGPRVGYEMQLVQAEARYGKVVAPYAPGSPPPPPSQNGGARPASVTDENAFAEMLKRDAARAEQENERRAKAYYGNREAGAVDSRAQNPAGEDSAIHDAAAGLDDAGADDLGLAAEDGGAGLQ